jgi:2-phosphosulfolactate phosphatase
MVDIDVIFQKEMVIPERMTGNIAVVIDVLLATTTIASALESGATEVIPVRDRVHAMEVARKLSEESFLLAGEDEGIVIPGFLPPWPTSLKQHVKGKTLILSTSNGTVALNMVNKAKKIYASSLINGESVASHIRSSARNENIFIVCSGSDGSFSLEDFLGAGYFLQCLIEYDSNHYNLTDAAKTALYFYQRHEKNYLELLFQSVVGRELEECGLKNEVIFASRRSVLSIVPEYLENKLISVE